MKGPKTKENIPKAKKKPSALPRNVERLLAERYRAMRENNREEPQNPTEAATGQMESAAIHGIQAGKQALFSSIGSHPKTLKKPQSADPFKARGGRNATGGRGKAGGYRLRKNSGSGAARYRVVRRETRHYPNGRASGASGARARDAREAARVLQKERFHSRTLHKSKAAAVRRFHTPGHNPEPVRSRPASPDGRQSIKKATGKPSTRKLSTVKAGRAGFQAGRSIKHRGNPARSMKNYERRAKQAAIRTKQAAKVTARFTARVVKAILKAAAAAVRGLLVAAAGGGGFLLFIFVAVAAVAMLMASPFGIFFSGHNDPDTKSLAQIVSEYSLVIGEEIQGMREETAVEMKVVYVDMDGGLAGAWPDVIAVFAVRTALDPDGAADVVTLDAGRESRLTQTCRDMLTVESEITEETRTRTYLDENDVEVTEEYIHRTQNVYVSVSSASQGADLYGFDANQREALDELMRPENVAFLMGMTGGTVPGPTLSAEEYARLKAALEGLTPDRQGLVEAALSLVGKVNYFWGGKSSAIGPDERWGTPMTVTATGSKSTGTTRPFGLDCSGFAAWTYHQIGVHPDILGWGSRTQWERSRAVSWEDAQIGDLVFFAVPGTSAQHVGLIVGFNEEGRPLAAHCNSTHNNVTVDDAKRVGFRYVRRTLVFEDDIGEMNG